MLVLDTTIAELVKEATSADEFRENLTIQQGILIVLFIYHNLHKYEFLSHKVVFNVGAVNALY